MENSGRKSELMKPLFLKAGIPLVISVAGFIYSLIRTRRSFCREEDREEYADEDSFQECLEGEEEEFGETTQTMNSLINSGIHYRPNLEEVISVLLNQIIILQHRERDLERRFLCYCGLKEYELAATKFQNSLALEQARLEFLGTTIESMEAEKRRFELLVDEYLRVLMQVRSRLLENSLLRKKVKKLLIVRRKYSRVVHRQASKLQARAAEISRNQEELQLKEQVIVGLNTEVVALKGMAEQLEMEKTELLDKLESSASKVEETAAGLQDQLLITELERLQKQREAEAEELVYLRWMNACFKHEEVRNQEHGHGDEKIDDVLRYDSDTTSSITDQGESCAFVGSHKKHKLLHKLGRWVKGNETCSRSGNGKKHEYKYDRNGVGMAEQHVKARKSCSSA